MCKWREAVLGDLCVYLKRGVTPSYLEEEGVAVLNQRCIRNQRVDFANQRRTDPKKRAIPAEKLLREFDVLVNSTGVGTLGRVAQVLATEEPTTVDSHVTVVRPNPKEVEPYFFGFLLRALESTIERLGQGSTGQTELSRERISSIPVRVPSRSTQIKIAHILGTLDDKIELNRRMNQRLEAIARAIFKSWFIDFDPVIDNAILNGKSIPDEFSERAAIRCEILARNDEGVPGYRHLFPDSFQGSPLGKIPEGWGPTDFGSVCEVLNGGTPSTKVEEYWHSEEIAWATPTDITALGSPIIRATARCISQLGLENSSAKLLPPGSVLVTSRATIGYSAVSSVPISTNQGFKSLVCKKPVTSLFMLQVVRMLQRELINLASGSTYPEINAATFKRIRFVLPSKDLILAFEATAARLFAKIEANDTEIESLGHTRDSLLPNLLSGWLKVANA